MQWKVSEVEAGMAREWRADSSVEWSAQNGEWQSQSGEESGAECGDCRWSVEWTVGE